MKRVHAFALAALAGIAAGLLWSPDSVMYSDGPEGVWSSPALSDLRRYDSSDLDVVRQAVHWGGENQEPSEVSEQLPWRLAGISRGAEAIALFQMSESKQLLRLQAGDSLPDGTRVERIENGRVVVVNGDCRRNLQLYRPGQSESSSGCLGAGQVEN